MAGYGKEYDVIVVGSGAGGATVAREAVRKLSFPFSLHPSLVWRSPALKQILITNLNLNQTSSLETIINLKTQCKPNSSILRTRSRLFLQLLSALAKPRRLRRARLTHRSDAGSVSEKASPSLPSEGSQGAEVSNASLKMSTLS